MSENYTMIHIKLQKIVQCHKKGRYHTAKTVILKIEQLEAWNAIAIFLTHAHLCLIESIHPIPKYNYTITGEANVPNTKNLPNTNQNRS